MKLDKKTWTYIIIALIIVFLIVIYAYTSSGGDFARLFGGGGSYGLF